MKVLIFGATGMVGQGVLRECLLDCGVEGVTAIGRGPSGADHPKLHDLVHRDLWNYTAIEKQLSGFDACFFCLGVTSAGMKEARHLRNRGGRRGNAGAPESANDVRIRFRRRHG